MKQDALTSSLSHRVTIEQPVNDSDGAGGYTTSWDVVATLWAKLETVSRNTGERELDEQLNVVERLRMTIRHRSDINHTMRVLIDGELWNIRSVIDPDQRGIMSECLLEKGVAI